MRVCLSDEERLSQHLRAKHQYQKRLETSDSLQRAGYALAELHLLAEAEVGLLQPTRFVDMALADLGIVDRMRQWIRQIWKRSNYRALVFRLASESAKVAETASERTPKPPIGDTLPRSFKNDPKYRKLFARSVAGRIAGWPQHAVEGLTVLSKMSFRISNRLSGRLRETEVERTLWPTGEMQACPRGSKINLLLSVLENVEIQPSGANANSLG